MRLYLWALCLLLAGCTLDPRPQALRRGLDQARSVLADPRLRALAEKSSQGPLEERLVEALFSADGLNYWPPRRKSEWDYDYKDQSKLPGRIAYLREPDAPWSVVVRADAKNHRIILLGYGMLLDQPLLRDAMPVTPSAQTSRAAPRRPLKVTEGRRTLKTPSVHCVVVTEDDCVWRLLQRFGWSDAEILARRLVGEVARLNHLSNPDLIGVGQVLRLPGKVRSA